ncbi:MAG: rod shape-determining protein RodA [Thermacetogeniaceae bacterium]
MFSRRLRNLDYNFLLVIGLILVMNLLVLSSAAAATHEGALYYVKRQALWIVLGLIAAGFITFSFDYSKLHQWHHTIYGAMVVMLVAVLIIGHVAKGAQRSIDFGALVLQPSEFAKIMIIVCFASYLSRRQGEMKHLKDLVPCFLYFTAPFVMVFIQPDLGTSLVFIVIFFGMLYLAGARPSLLLKILGGCLGVIALALALHFSPLHMPLPLKDYQMSRLTVFLDPYSDPQGDGYHIIQSLVAIGSGGLWGKGLYHGSQVQLNFLPEHHTDFIFSVVGEELGFLGAGILLILYYNLITRTLSMAFKSRDSFGRLMIGGIICMWLFHVLENIGMTVGIMPITGIPLPFMSYGGSFMLANMIAVGLILNIYLRHELMLF